MYRRWNLFVIALENWGRRSNGKFLEFVLRGIGSWFFPTILPTSCNYDNYIITAIACFEYPVLRYTVFFPVIQIIRFLVIMITSFSNLFFELGFGQETRTGTRSRRIHAYYRSLQLDYSGSVADPGIYMACANLLHPRFVSARYNGKFKQPLNFRDLS